MPRGKQKPRHVFGFPEIEVGDWHGEFAGAPSGNIGQHIQPGPPCPSSNDLRPFRLWKNGVSGSGSWLI